MALSTIIRIVQKLFQLDGGVAGKQGITAGSIFSSSLELKLASNSLRNKISLYGIISIVIRARLERCSRVKTFTQRYLPFHSVFLFFSFRKRAKGSLAR